ncbi:MAG TPA: TolC family protein [Bacteroidales bacterium]|nr:TolC family protein [Bacteroidales bacterium]
MKNRRLINLLLIFSLTGTTILAQGSSELRLSLKEAQDYALMNNKSVLNARQDVAASKVALWETISNALPQVSATGTFVDNLKLMTTLLPGEFFGQPGTKIPVTFGSKFNSSGSVEASLVLFNGPLYVGIETTKLAKKLSEENLVKSEQDTRESVSTAYFLILVSEESLRILEGNIANLTETLKSTRSMFAAGMAESTDVDQMVSNLTMVENTRSSMLRTIELNYNLMRFQLGVAPDTKIILSENLEVMTKEIDVEALLTQGFDPRNNVNFRLVEGQEQLTSLALKGEKASVLPTLAGFYNYGTSGMGDKVSDLSWFPNSMTGLSLSIPIFASGQRYSKIRKAQIELDKARTTKGLVMEQLLIQEKQLRYNLANANEQYKSQKNNIDVAKRVYSSMENKYRQGMASSLELTQANSLYLEAENNYVAALMNLLQTKIALDKLLNNI